MMSAGEAASIVGEPIDRSCSTIVDQLIDAVGGAVRMVAGEAKQLPIPVTIEAGLRAYAIDRRPTGDFLRAVLENDLTNAALRADPRNQLLLSAIVLYCTSCLPATCWGSAEKVRAWLATEPDPAA